MSKNDHIIDIPGVGPVAFPASMPDFEVAKVAKRLHDEARDRSTPAAVGLVNPATVAASDVARMGAGRVGMQVATSPNLGRVVGGVSKPAAQATARAIGATG